MRILVLICGLSLTLSAIAQVSLPKGCKSVEVQGDVLTLKAKKTSLFFIHNRTQTELWLTHPVNKPGASAGWSSRLQANRWSSLVVNKKSFVLHCIESRPGHEQQIPCEGALAVCRVTKLKMPADSKSTFWGAEDLSLSALKAALGARGFVLNNK